MPSARLSLLAAAAVVAMSLSVTAPVFAASTVVECGQVTAYTAPDPAGPTDGSLTIGLLDPWTIAADASLSAAVSTTLPTVIGSSPICLTTSRDDADVITALDFAPEGDVSGDVVFDAGAGGYIFASRLLIPTFIIDTYPGLAAIFATSAAAETDATVTFFFEADPGRLTSIDATASFCGRGDLAPDGDGIVGEARIPASVLDSTDTRRLATADSRNACATVHTHGTLDADTGALTLTTEVTIEVAPAALPSVVKIVTPPPTSTLADAETSSAEIPVAYLAIIWLVTLVTAALAHQRRRKRL
jgi:hypothetical protein